MPTTPESRSPWLGPAAAVAGLLLLAASFLVPSRSVTAYSAADAKRYQEVSDRLHALSGQAGSPDATPQQQRELRDSQVEFIELKGKLDAAKQRGPRLRQALRYGGTALIAGGLIAVAFASPQASAR